MDLTESIQPRSDQVNADDLIAGPITYTVREVTAGKAEQPFDFLLVETDRAYRPSKTMRRVIVNAWGSEAANYTGRRLTLYREPSIQFGGKTVGGIRISHMSHIDGPLEVMAQTTRGKREKFAVKPLAKTATAAPTAGTVEQPNQAANLEAQPAAAANEPAAVIGGGLVIDSEDAAARLIRAMTVDQLKALKVLLDIKGETTKAALATQLYAQRIDWMAGDILDELAAMA